ncbi:hypothetical protein EPN52_05435 [bacterium]|nr:MAG: hypothetical protein EPN52_05435 [bacterium]
MIKFGRWPLAALAGALALSLTLPALAAPTARFSSDGSYTGSPNLALTLSMIEAGGGPAAYKTTTLVGVLAGPKAGAEVAKLQQQFGKDNVAQFIKTFDFVVGDSLKIVTAKKIALPKTADPAPSNGKALAAALYKAGVSAQGSYNVEYMLDDLVSHPIHVQVMDDIDAKYGAKADAEYHVILLQVMKDLKAVYGL